MLPLRHLHKTHCESVILRLLHVLRTWRIAEEPSNVYGVEGVEIGRSAAEQAESGAGALGELMLRDVETRRVGDGPPEAVV